MDLLALLVKRRGALVSREEIAAHLWPEPGLVDVDQGINTAVRRVREVLVDDAIKPRFIETVVGKGYRFVPQIIDIPGESATGETPQEASTVIELELSSRATAADAALPGIAAPDAATGLEAGSEVTKSKLPRYALATAAGFFLVLVLATLCAIWYQQRARNRGRTGSLVQVTTNDSEQRVTAAAISPDGKWIAYADLNNISLRVAQTGESFTLKGPQGFRTERMVWFPNQLKLLVSGFAVRDVTPQIWTAFVTGSEPRLFRTNAENGTPSPDGSRVLFTTQYGVAIWTAGVDGEDAKPLIVDHSGNSFPIAFWSMDGRRICYVRRRSVLVNGDFECADASSGKVVARERNIAMDAALPLNDGRIVFLRRTAAQLRNTYSIWEAQTDPQSGAFRSIPTQVAEFGSAKALSFSSSRDGRSMAVVLEKGEPHVYVGELEWPGPALTRVQRLTYDTREDYPHAWLHDNETIVFESDRQGTFRLYKQRLGDATAVELSTGSEQAVIPQVTPDGKWILYAEKPDVQPSPRDRLFRIPVEDGTPAEVPIGGPLDEVECPISGHSGCVLRETLGNKQFIFYRLDPVHGKGPEVGRAAWLPHVVEDWCVSPEASYVALTTHEGGASRIRVVALDQRTAQPEQEVDVQGLGRLSGIRWTPDGDGWYVASDTDSGTLLIYVNRKGESRLLRDTPLGTWAVPSPDGRKLAFVDEAVDSNVWIWEQKPRRPAREIFTR